MRIINNGLHIKVDRDSTVSSYSQRTPLDDQMTSDISRDCPVLIVTNFPCPPMLSAPRTIMHSPPKHQSTEALPVLYELISPQTSKGLVMMVSVGVNNFKRFIFFLILTFNKSYKTLLKLFALPGKPIQLPAVTKHYICIIYYLSFINCVYNVLSHASKSKQVKLSVRIFPDTLAVLTSNFDTTLPPPHITG